MKITVFRGILKKSQVNEIWSIIVNSKMTVCVGLDKGQVDVNDFQTFELKINPFGKGPRSLMKIIGGIFRTKDSHYYVKSNSLNFNMTELGFQTYEAFLTHDDALNIINDLDDTSVAEFENLLKSLLGYHPDDKVKQTFEKLVEDLSNGHVLTNDDVLFTTLQEISSDVVFLSNAWNKILLIDKWLDKNPATKEFVKHYFTMQKSQQVLQQLRSK